MKDTRRKLKEDSIFSLKPALQFAVVFLIIKLFSKLSLVFFGNSGFYITAALSSITGIDAITITIGEIVGKSLSYETAITGLVIANSVNLLGKSIFAFNLGKREFAFSFLAGALIIIGVSTLSLFIF